MDMNTGGLRSGIKSMLRLRESAIELLSFGITFIIIEFILYIRNTFEPKFAHIRHERQIKILAKFSLELLFYTVGLFGVMKKKTVLIFMHLIPSILILRSSLFPILETFPKDITEAFKQGSRESGFYVVFRMLTAVFYIVVEAVLISYCIELSRNEKTQNVSSVNHLRTNRAAQSAQQGEIVCRQLRDSAQFAGIVYPQIGYSSSSRPSAPELTL